MAKGNFINIAKYPGGNKSLIKFINDNLIYPEDALLQGIEGKVIIQYEVDYKGDTINIKVAKGIGYGCDEEAMRLIKLLKYIPQKNIGISVKLNCKTTINFKIMKHNTINIHVTNNNNETKIKKTKNKYEYSINL